jgi:hypothetical protein
MKSNKYQLSAIVFSLISTSLVLVLANRAFALQYGDFTYTVHADNTVTITTYTGAGGAVVIPIIINDMPVVGIGGYTLYREGVYYYYGAFYNRTNLTSVVIPNSVTRIANWAFYYCANLTTAYFLGNAPSMGSNVFENCASNFSICYTAGATGFTTPAWYGYPAKVCSESTTTTTTIPSSPCAAESIYGEQSEQTELLREYRDNVLSKSATGRQMIKTYYELSPAVAEVLQKNTTARANARRVLDLLMPAIREKVNP